MYRLYKEGIPSHWVFQEVESEEEALAGLQAAVTSDRLAMITIVDEEEEIVLHVHRPSVEEDGGAHYIANFAVLFSCPVCGVFVDLNDLEGPMQHAGIKTDKTETVYYIRVGKGYIKEERVMTDGGIYVERSLDEAYRPERGRMVEDEIVFFCSKCRHCVFHTQRPVVCITEKPVESFEIALFKESEEAHRVFRLMTANQKNRNELIEKAFYMQLYVRRMDPNVYHMSFSGEKSGKKEVRVVVPGMLTGGWVPPTSRGGKYIVKGQEHEL